MRTNERGGSRSPENSFSGIADLYDLFVQLPDGCDTEFVEYLHTGLFREHQVKNVLDCACGTGHQSVGLLRLGYNVISSDMSADALQKAALNARSYNLELHPVVATWDKLEPEFGANRFDAVLCTGNSFYLCEGDEAKSLHAEQMRAVLRPGGLLFIDFERWDKEFHVANHDGTRRARFELYGYREHQGQNIICCSTYEHEGRKQLLDFFYIVEHEKTFNVKKFSFTGHAFTSEELIDLLRRAGFSEARSVDRPGIWSMEAVLAIK